MVTPQKEKRSPSKTSALRRRAIMVSPNFQRDDRVSSESISEDDMMEDSILDYRSDKQ